MTPEEHRERHELLHKMLDELMADYLIQHRTALPSNTTVLELMKWSAEQKQNPTERGGES